MRVGETASVANCRSRSEIQPWTCLPLERNLFLIMQAGARGGEGVWMGATSCPVLQVCLFRLLNV